jgi:hypothetical protein
MENLSAAQLAVFSICPARADATSGVRILCAVACSGIVKLPPKCAEALMRVFGAVAALPR